MVIPELLAPAGSAETFMAGMDAGADAFYLGVSDFNARKRAKNFTREELEQAVAFAHGRNKRIYVTLNTLVFDSEIPTLVDLLLFLDRIRVDAVIVQDLGVLSILRTYFPGLRIHASTQMFCHNSLQAQFLKDAGVSRIVLARELSLQEIKAVREKVPLEYEAFIHGALCFSFSGCCLFSSYRFNASGNRGECRQVCRHAFNNNGRDSYPFSMKDLNTSGILEQVISAGLTSLKIEGRLKNADYIKKTVSLYRRLLDGYAEKGRMPAPGSDLEGQRTFTSGYFKGADYADITETEKQGILGEPIGTAEIPRAGTAVLHVDRDLQKGSRLRLMDPKGRVACEGTLLEFNTQRKDKTRVITWQLSDAQVVRYPLRVLLLGSTQPQDHHRAFKHALSTGKNIPVNVSLVWDNGTLEFKASSRPVAEAFKVEYPLALEPSRSGDGNALLEKIHEIFLETADLPLKIEKVDITLPKGMFARISSIKNIRREAYEAFHAEYLRIRDAGAIVLRERVLTDLAAIQQNEGTEGPLPMEYDKLIFTEIGEMPSVSPEEKPLLLLPVFIPEEKTAFFKEWLADLQAEGYTRIVCAAYGQIAQAAAGWDEVLTGPYVYSVNSFARQFIRAKGVSGCILSPDMRLSALSPVDRYASSVVLTGQPDEVFVTRLSIPEGSYLLKADSYDVVQRNDYSVLISRP